MSNPTVVFDPYASADLRDIVQTMVDNYNVAITGQAEWYPVASFLVNRSFFCVAIYGTSGGCVLEVSSVSASPLRTVDR